MINIELPVVKFRCGVIVIGIALIGKCGIAVEVNEF